jgi:hypothetical protein
VWSRALSELPGHRHHHQTLTRLPYLEMDGCRQVGFSVWCKITKTVPSSVPFRDTGLIDAVIIEIYEQINEIRGPATTGPGPAFATWPASRVAATARHPPATPRRYRFPDASTCITVAIFLLWDSHFCLP